MNKNLLIIVMICLPLFSIAQSATEILQKSYHKCQSVKNGYYEMSKYMKYMDGKDTNRTRFKCSFKKRVDDTLFSTAFHSQAIYNDSESYTMMYTGDEHVFLNPKDSIATIMARPKWDPDVRSRCKNTTFYSPLTSKKSSPIEHDSEFTDNRHVFKLIGEEKLNGMICYHIQVNEKEEFDTIEMMNALRIEFHYWINKKDFIPIQYTIAFDMVIKNDTQYQYERFVLEKYEINHLKDESVLSLKCIPAFYKKKDYVPYEAPKLLPADTLAPNWNLPSLSGGKINLADLKGQLVLIDFFYKACYPCMQAIPVLQSLNEKYKAQGLQIVGVDPFDKDKEALASFLGKMGVTYPILLEGKTVAKDYHVSGYPTVYLIDRTGRIIYSAVGYGKDTEAQLEEIIKKNL